MQLKGREPEWPNPKLNMGNHLPSCQKLQKCLSILNVFSRLGANSTLFCGLGHSISEPLGLLKLLYYTKDSLD